MAHETDTKAVRNTSHIAATANIALESNDFPCRATVLADGQLGMVANRAITAGERVLIEKPLVLTPTPDARPFTCAGCFADSRKRHASSFQGFKDPTAPQGFIKRWQRRCAGCKVLRFCSEECEARLQRRHRQSCECDALGAIARQELAAQRPVVDPLAENMLAQALRLLADRHAAMRLEALRGLIVGYEDGAARLLSVDRSWPPAALVAQAVDAALRLVPPEARVPAEELADLLRRQQCNVYGVSSPTGSDVGRAAFVGAMHLFNHSCAPNLYFDSMPMWPAGSNRTAGHGVPRAAPLCGEEAGCDTAAFSLVSLLDVPCGAELTIAYTGVDSGVAQRRAHLLEYYGFECKCARCTAEETGREVQVGTPSESDLRSSVSACREGGE